MVIGLVCSSFVTVSAGTHRRCPSSPYGQSDVRFVRVGNLLASRFLSWFNERQSAYIQQWSLNWATLLGSTHSSGAPNCPLRVCALLLVISCMNGCFILEQPRSSGLIWLPRVRRTFRLLPKVVWPSNFFAVPIKLQKSVYLFMIVEPIFTVMCLWTTLKGLPGFLVDGSLRRAHTKTAHCIFKCKHNSTFGLGNSCKGSQGIPVTA